MGAVPTSTAKVVLAPVAPALIAADTMACLKHMSVKGLDSAGLEADGWKRYQPSDLPGRHFIASVAIYADGDGIALGDDSALNPQSACTLVALPTPSPDFGPIAEQLSAKLDAHPVFQKPGSVLWAPNGPDDVLIMLTKDPERSDLVDVVMRASPRPANRVNAPIGQQG
ncbi:MAG: hypothetical protein JWM94_2776 [Sphingomonas bacterium]|nr:hypothetical protein [Sphingomonas bacterium]